MTSLKTLVGAATIALLASACAAPTLQTGNVQVDDAWARAPLTADHPVPIYMRIVNNSDEPDQLISASSTAAGDVELQETYAANSQAKMGVDAIEIPAGGEVVLSPNNLQVTLQSPNGLYRQGSTVPVSLTFARAGTIQILARVAAPGASGP